MKTLFLLSFLASSLCLAETKTLKVTGMTCNSCVKSVTKAVCADMHFEKGHCDVKIGELKVTSDKLDVPAIQAALEKAGYGLEKEVPAPATTPTKK